MSQHHDDHDLGLAHDLPRLIGRRRLLAVLGGIGATAALPASAACVALPWETAGPFPADGTNSKAGQVVNALAQEGILRSDLRTSFGAYTPGTEGVPLEVELTLVDASGCTPLAGHAIYLWHCDAEGRYSLYDVTDANWLRGLGVADAEGKVRFTTIVPGCYAGRWPHMHFEVFENVEAAVTGKASVLTAQIAIPQAECAEVYETDATYSNGTRNLGRITMQTDNIFADNSAAEVAQQTMAMTGSPEQGYSGKVTIPVDFNADRTVSMAPPAGGGFPPPPRN